MESSGHSSDNNGWFEAERLCPGCLAWGLTARDGGFSGDGCAVVADVAVDIREYDTVP